LVPSPASAATQSRAALSPCVWRLLFLALVLVYFLPAGFRPLANPDEGRYTEIAREMAVTGDYISPRLNGVLFFEKPPLFYWLEAGAESVGGINLWAVRFWPIVLALLGCAAVYYTGRSLWGASSGVWSAWTLATGLLYYAISQIVILDMAVSVFLTLAMCAFMLAVREPPGPRRRWLCWALYASMALALLTKGLIGLVIPLAIIFFWLLFLNKWRELRQAHLFSGLIILLALALPWHIAAALATPPQPWAHFFSRSRDGQGFLWYYLVHEHFLRFTDPSTANRVQPWWFFSAILVAGFLPWTFFLPSALISSCKGGWARVQAEPEILLLFLWALFPLVFFSISSSKLIPYIVPSVPPLALLTGRFLARALEAPADPVLRTPLRGLSIFCLLLAGGILLFNLIKSPLPISTFSIYALAAFLVLFGCWMLRGINRAHGKMPLVLLGLNGFILVFLVLAIQIASQVQESRKPSTAPAAAWLRPRLQATDQVFTLMDYSPYQDFAPLLGRTVGIAGHIPDEQEFGLQLETSQLAPRYPGLADYFTLRRTTAGATAAQVMDVLMPPFLKILQGSARVYVLVDATQFPTFQKNYPTATAHAVWHDDHFVLFCNQPAELK
jgi:4-amino-4-deoxy-L-arabinose transferase-like glycosyltransferase